MSFADDIRRFSEKTKLNLNLVHRKVILDLLDSVVSLSPVDTGRFRNNWYVSQGTPNTATNTGTMDPTSRLHTMANLMDVGGIVYITNSLPYAIPLEYGWSAQAPQGMVRITVRNYQQYIENQVRKLK